MKKFIIRVAAIIVISLTIGLFFYQRSPKLVPDRELGNNQTQTEVKTILQGNNVTDNIGYSLQDQQLQITYDQGKHWTVVPVELESLFAGEYNGNKKDLIEKSYILTDTRAGFIYGEGSSWENESIYFMYSEDQGKTWHKSIVAEQYLGVRFRKVDFLSDSFGYIILSGGRTMSQEGSNVFLTYDGGENWQETENYDVTRLIADGGFVDEKTGFLSYGVLNPVEPDFYYTNDAGDTWGKAEIHVPSQYHEIFVQAEVPIKEGDHLALFINQGPNGDYKGGKVKGKFISSDNGQTWEFVEEMAIDEQDIQ